MCAILLQSSVRSIHSRCWHGRVLFEFVLSHLTHSNTAGFCSVSQNYCLGSLFPLSSLHTFFALGTSNYFLYNQNVLMNRMFFPKVSFVSRNDGYRRAFKHCYTTPCHHSIINMSDMFGDQNPHDFLTPNSSPEQARAAKTQEQPWPLPLSREKSISLLQRTLDLLPGQTSSIHDSPTVFISINLGHSATTLDPHDVLEVGVAVLDNRNIASTTPKQKGFPIRTHDFMITCVRGCIEISTPFAFGPCTKISPKKLDALFQRIASGLQHEKPLYQTHGAKIVLPGKNIAGTLRLMDMVVPDFWKDAKIDGIVDLDVLTEQRCFFSLLEELDIRPEFGDRCLFCPGNDANYALRAVLLYTCYTVEDGRGSLTRQVEENLELVTSVSLEGIPNGPVLSCSHGVKNNAITAVGEWRRNRDQKVLEKQSSRKTWHSQCDGTGYFETLLRRLKPIHLANEVEREGWWVSLTYHWDGRHWSGNLYD
ncbi:hypothetical protein ONS95_008916 [Cadophora gregata]|uniref:uncharacterized protein n=1 Tax=Cadophora gregata TaxID=51156 RepID=UPI0026DCFC7C|nr:uncharacterized protein ONS95_008916 [Cadophora gregata]KAK0123926.1 hypothetical protein ONS95_008916 [Cadophora gregata]KAK0130265.1 hypothetical protein ONS96_000788 [Cadophora gregata f. sp. sojae]